MPVSMKNLANKPFNINLRGHKNIETNSVSKIKKITQNIRNRKETGNTLTLKESNPHSKISKLKCDLLIITLTITIIKGISKGIRILI